jgi:glutamate transport system permease protein
MSETILYDKPGPRTRRTTLIVSIVAGLAVIAALYFFVYVPLDEHGQFTMRKWGPLIDPENRYFTLLWKRLWTGVLATLSAAGLAIVASLTVGTVLAVLRVQFQHLRRRRFGNQGRAASVALQALTKGSNGWLRGYVEVARGLPVIITIFFVSRVLPEFGLDFFTLWYLVIGLAIYNGVVIAEILRSGMTGLPGGQREAASALGFSSFKTIRLILLPQAFRIMLPALISQLVVVVKDTSLGFLISYEDLLQITTQAINNLNNPIQLYTAIAVIFILINYTLSKLAVYAERRVARGRKTVAGPAPTPPPSIMAGTAAAGAGGTAG